MGTDACVAGKAERVDRSPGSRSAQVKIAGTLKKSTDIMQSMNQLVKLPAIAKVMQEMSQEMMKVGSAEFEPWNLANLSVMKVRDH